MEKAYCSDYEWAERICPECQHHVTEGRIFYCLPPDAEVVSLCVAEEYRKEEKGFVDQTPCGEFWYVIPLKEDGGEEDE